MGTLIFWIGTCGGFVFGALSGFMVAALCSASKHSDYDFETKEEEKI